MRGSFLANAFRANAFRWIPAKSHRLFIKYRVIDDCTRVRVLAVYGFAKHLADKLGPEQLRWYQAHLLPEKNITP